MAVRSHLSDEELRRQLKECGEAVGPITATTRALYLRKLAKLRKSGGTNSSPKSSVMNRAKGKSPVRRSPASKASTSPSRRLIGFSSDEEENESPAKSRRSFLSKRETGAGERQISSRCTDSSKMSQSSFDLSEEESGTGTANQRSHVVSEIDGYVYRGTPLRLRALNQSRLKRSPDSRSKPDEFLGEVPRNSVLRQLGVEGRESHSCRRLVLVLLVSVLIGVALYVFLRNPTFVRNFSSNPENLPLCDGGDLVKGKSLTCIKLVDLCRHYALKYLYTSLAHQAGLAACGYAVQRNISVATFKSKIKDDNTNRTGEEQDGIFEHTLKLVANNSQKWHIRLFDKDGAEVDATNLEAVQWLDTSVAAKPFLCRVADASNLLVFRIVMFLAGVAALLLVYFVVRHHWRREEEETRRMYKFVERIIDVLKEHHEASKKDNTLLPYLPIPHVRDMLIAPSDRQKLSKPWNRAVRFLSANESRIRVESQRIAGEDFEVWRWIHSVTPKTSSTKGPTGVKEGKFWQGQAFENFQSAVNPPIISPSPCLKIRNMFEPVMEVSESWHILIQDAIVEKCSGSGASIVHIAVDKSSSEGCVYVKCDSHRSAGLAFRSLHGCWFDGRLVAVKYLTLKRYHQRFPAAQEAVQPLKLSGKSPTSLVTFDPDEDVGDLNDSDLD